MVFSRIGRWLSSIFGSSKDDELDKVIDLTVRGFTRTNSRMDGLSSELEGLKNELQASRNAQDSNITLIASRLKTLESSATHVEEVKSLRQELTVLQQHVNVLAVSTEKQSKKRIPKPSHNIVATENNIVTTQTAPVATAVATVPVKSARTVITRRNMNRVLPAALIPVFDELLNAEKFLSYANLAKRLVKKEATARAYVNELRTRGVAIDEETGPNGRKLVRLSKDVRREYMIPE